MRTAKCLVIVLVSAAVVFGAERRISNTKEASCLVRITADPEIIPLNQQTVNHLIHSSAVVGKTAREVLELDPEANPGIHKAVETEWLAQTLGALGQKPGPGEYGGRTTGSTSQPRDAGHAEMMSQLAEIYGDRYVGKLPPEDSAPTKADAQEDTPGMMMGGGMMGGRGMGGGMMGGGMMGGGGMGGGMMGGGGMGGGMGGMYGSPRPGISATAMQQSITLRLSVHLPEHAEPAAQEFLQALVENLRSSLKYAYERHEGQIAEALQYKEHQRDSVQDMLEEAIGAKPKRTNRGTQLEQTLQTVVDLSMLSPEMPLAEAIDRLRSAVEPPLPIVVMWRELLDSCDIEPTTPIDMDGLPSVKLGTALRMLVGAISGGFADISYQIDDDVIVIREEELQESQPVPASSIAEIDVRELANLRRSLARGLQRLEMDAAVSRARRQAIEEQIAELRHRTREKLEADVASQELQKIIDAYTKQLPLYEGASDLIDLKEKLARVRIELVQRQEALSKSVGGSRFAQLNEELSQMAIDTAQSRAEMEIVHRQLAATEDQLVQASRFDPRAARIRSAREALDIAETQVTRLRARLASLQPPTVALIGAN